MEANLIDSAFYSCTAPSNSSRTFLSQYDAVEQPTASIDLRLDLQSGFVYNAKFNSELIRYDSNYNTVDVFQFSDSIQHLEPIINSLRPQLVVDVGCGQGELVTYLCKKGINAIGFDPTLTIKDDLLFREFFDPAMLREHREKSCFFIMRCVLPHVENPFAFLDSIHMNFPLSTIFLEFQNLDWILSNRCWMNISHDHVNYFSITSFKERYILERSGSFAEGEWAYVVLSGTRNQRLLSPPPNNLVRQFELMRLSKQNLLENLLRIKDNLLIYGAAGKGTQLSYELSRLGLDNVTVIDNNIHKQGRFLEASGYKISSLDDARKNLNSNSVIFVSNPRHAKFVRSFFDSTLVKVQSDFRPLT